MSELKKPLAVDDAAFCIRDAEGEGIAELFIESEALQIVRELNAFDALLAACKLALSCNPCGGCEIALRQAIEKAEGKA